jgi:hypothetical protein
MSDLTPAAYYRLCAEADRLGIPTSLDDPRSPRTVAGLRAAVDAAVEESRLIFVLVQPTGDLAYAETPEDALGAAETLIREAKEYGASEPTASFYVGGTLVRSDVSESQVRRVALHAAGAVR